MNKMQAAMIAVYSTNRLHVAVHLLRTNHRWCQRTKRSTWELAAKSVTSFPTTFRHLTSVIYKILDYWTDPCLHAIYLFYMRKKQNPVNEVCPLTDHKNQSTFNSAYGITQYTQS